jgi:hypothetical protein
MINGNKLDRNVASQAGRGDVPNPKLTKSSITIDEANNHCLYFNITSRQRQLGGIQKVSAEVHSHMNGSNE